MRFGRNDRSISKSMLAYPRYQVRAMNSNVEDGDFKFYHHKFFDVDGCVDDQNKTDPGECGCVFPDIDSENDGTIDCKGQSFPQVHSKGCRTNLMIVFHVLSLSY